MIRLRDKAGRVWEAALFSSSAYPHELESFCKLHGLSCVRVPEDSHNNHAPRTVTHRTPNGTTTVNVDSGWWLLLRWHKGSGLGLEATMATCTPHQMMRDYELVPSDINVPDVMEAVAKKVLNALDIERSGKPKPEVPLVEFKACMSWDDGKPQLHVNSGEVDVWRMSPLLFKAWEETHKAQKPDAEIVEVVVTVRRVKP